jgi:tryptophan synthase alpha chain
MSKSLVAYVTVGDPSLASSYDIVLAALDAGADVIELGVPFSDPVADGPVIQRASDRAVRRGVTLKEVVELAGRVRKARAQAKLITFTYFNPVLRYGIERFAEEAQKSEIAGALITDLAVEESRHYCSTMRKRSLDTIFLAAPTSSDARLRAVAKSSSGFIYAVSRTGVTGAEKQGDIAGEVRRLVTRIRKHSKLPIAVGFGISAPEHFRAVTQYADAAVVGSAIVAAIEKEPDNAPQAVAALIKKLKG